MSLCLFHGDLDGHTPAAIIDKRFHIDKFIVASYDMEIPFDKQAPAVRSPVVSEDLGSNGVCVLPAHNVCASWPSPGQRHGI